jgi:prophage regulatory protein
MNTVHTLSLPEVGFVRLADVLRFIPVGRSTFWKRVKEGEYPQPVKLGKNSTAWRASDIRQLIEKIESQPKAA